MDTGTQETQEIILYLFKIYYGALYTKWVKKRVNCSQHF